MYSLVRRFLKTAIGFLGVGLVLGLVMTVRRDVFGVPASGYLISAHTHLVLVGFVMGLIMGVALWLFPRPANDDRLYSPARMEAVYWLFAAATTMRFLGEVGAGAYGAQWLRWMAALGGSLQVVALLSYFTVMWGRIRATGSAIREAQGERF